MVPVHENGIIGHCESADTAFVLGLRCQECHRLHRGGALSRCERCRGTLAVAYDFEALRGALSRQLISGRETSLWRYRELLPVAPPARWGRSTGWTPLLRAGRLAGVLGMRELYIKNDGACAPTLSFKDRAAAVAIAAAIELGLPAVGCASMGNLAGAVAAHAAAAGLPAHVFVPGDADASNIALAACCGAQVLAVHGSFAELGRLCGEVAARLRWGIVNVNLRPYYMEGSKTVGFEIAEQLGWRAPDAVVVPVGGGALLTKIDQAFDELAQVGLLEQGRRPRMFAAQAAGASPVVEAVHRGHAEITPVVPRTLARSLAIGAPTDGARAAQIVLESGGWAERADDERIVAAIRLLAETEGLCAEPAGGVAVAALVRLLAEKRIRPDQTTVLVVSGHGLKAPGALRHDSAAAIGPSFAAFERALASHAPPGVHALSRALGASADPPPHGEHPT